jgi:hypothetical protein
MPLLGQSVRSWWRVVLVVIVSPHFGCGDAAGALRRAPEAFDLDVEAPLKATRPAAAKARITAREANVAVRRGADAWLTFGPPLSGRAEVRV